MYHSSSEELTEANNGDLWARLDAANYGEDGLVKVQTDITEAEVTIQDFFIAARAPLISDTLTSAIKVTLSCLDLTSITTTYIENTVPFVEDYSADGFFYKIFIGTPGTSETVDLSSVANYITDRHPSCLATGIDLVTDQSGTTAYTGGVFSEDAFTLTINT